MLPVGVALELESERLKSGRASLFAAPFSDALLATWRRTLSGRMLKSKLFLLLMLPPAPSPFGTASESILLVGDVFERRWSMGEFDVELPAVDGLRFTEGEDGRPMKIPDRRFDRGTEGPPTGDPRRPPCDDDDEAAAAACSCCRCCASVATS